MIHKNFKKGDLVKCIIDCAFFCDSGNIKTSKGQTGFIKDAPTKGTESEGGLVSVHWFHLNKVVDMTSDEIEIINKR